MRLPTKPIFPEPYEVQAHKVEEPKPPPPPPKVIKYPYFVPLNILRRPAIILGRPRAGKVVIKVEVDENEIIMV